MAFTATTVNSAAAWRPDLYTFAPADALPEALILGHTTIAGEVQGDQPTLRVAYCVDDNAAFVDEGAAIDESDPDLAEAVVITRKIAQLVRLSSEQYKQAGTPDELSRSVARALTTKADNALLAQAVPTAPAVAPVAGLLNTSGIVSKTDVAENLDKLIDLEAAVRANGANPTAWILAPDTWATLRKLKTLTPDEGTVTSNVGLLGAGTDNTTPLLLSIPVVVNNQMPAKSGLLIDKTAIITAVSQLEIATSAEQYFASDSIAVRATWRTGHVLPRPNRIGKFTTT